VAGLLIPLVALASWAIEPLALSFRPIELGALAVATVLPAVVLARGRTTRLGGMLLLAAYAGLVVAFAYAGNR
jgi:Ca2+/H+ antiporter